ncbi:glycosyl hydrolase family 28-related protein [Priestia aryabhattai]|uniref:glycosyl hydrolase family 28-related protein n=1 Tax=Priestia aryabhattai TaxID=412384 RepID=UPI0024535530|nr:glycosyl hydrolase family 28-related protein [Priestia aryabhattai]MDH3115884.1 glycosyl hydrolase family 28-related protein [Priestia aryabhattai]MDH3125224.1 glycosyl hydrolase family 28-related protein [Priestia aryabhattai]
MSYIKRFNIILKILLIVLIFYCSFYNKDISKVVISDSPTSYEYQSKKLNEKVPLYNVKDYGAKGDNLSDDTDKIKTAIKAAKTSGGGTIFFEKGTYLVSSFIEIPSNISILGEGKLNTTLKRTDKKTERILTLWGDQTVQDIGFNSKIGILPSGDNITVLDCKFQSSIQGIQNAVTIYNLIVINTIFENCGYGILSNVNPSFDVKIINCRFINITSDGIEININSERWVIENCIFDKNISKSIWAGVGVGAAISAKDITIKNSSFNNMIAQGVHVEDHAEVTIKNSSFVNCGSEKFTGSPKADIAVLSGAKVNIIDCVFYKSNKEYSDLAVYNTLAPVGGTVYIKNSDFYKKNIGSNISVQSSEFFE